MIVYKMDWRIEKYTQLHARAGRAGMKIVEFDGYGPNAPRVYLPVENIISFHMIDFNGNYGTEILLPEGRYIRVGAYPEEVKKAIEQQQGGQESE